MQRVIRVGAVRLGLVWCAVFFCAAVGLAQDSSGGLPETAVASGGAEVSAALGTEQLPNAPVATSIEKPGAAPGREQLPDAPVAHGSTLLALNLAPGAAQDDIDISWKKLPERILHDQKGIWLFPLQLARGRYWIPTLAVAGGTAGLIAADPHAMPYFRTHAGNWDDFNDAFDGPITSAETGIVPVAFLLVGGARHDAYASKTGLLAGEAYADGAIVDFALKGITRRKRPNEVTGVAPFNDTFFNTGKSALGSSFPSGHAVSAFSIATVVARRYGHHRWVPWVAYGCATAVSFSRVTTRAHFPSDVFVGAALGYSIARFEVLRH